MITRYSGSKNCRLSVIDTWVPIAYRAPMSVTRLAALSVVSAPVLTLAFSSVSTPLAHADDTDSASGTPIAARASADDDVFTPGLTHAAGHGRGAITGVMQYNGASKDTTLDLNGEFQVFGPVRLVVRVDNVTDKARPGVGAAVQFLDEAKHGAAASAYFTYKAEGFTEVEGELEIAARGSESATERAAKRVTDIGAR